MTLLLYLGIVGLGIVVYFFSKPYPAAVVFYWLNKLSLKQPVTV